MNIVDVENKLARHKTKKYRKRQIEDIDYIALHHSLTDDIPGGEDVFAFARYHVNDLGWPGIGYTYVIDTDGTIYKTAPATVVTYHVGKHNFSALGVCMVGDFRDSKPNEAQYTAVMDLLSTLGYAYKIPVRNIRGHSEFSGYEWKKCPAINMDKVREDVKNYDR